MVEDVATFPVLDPLGCHRSTDVEPDSRLVMEYDALLSIHKSCGCIVKV